MTAFGLLSKGLGWFRIGLKRDLNDGLAQGSLVIFLGHLARIALGLVTSVMLARGLGPEGLSVFSVTGTMIVIGGLVADVGLSTSAIRHIAVDLSQRPERAWRTAAAYARLKLLGILVTFLALLALAAPLARLLNLPATSGPTLLRIAALGLCATNLSGVTRTLLQAQRRFTAMTALQIVNGLLTLLFIGALFAAGRLTAPPALLVGAIAALVAASAGYFLLPVEWRGTFFDLRQSYVQESKELLRFGKWLWLAGIFWILAAQLDLILLNRWAAPAVVGFYALALNLYLKADLVNETLRTVLLPSVSPLVSRAAFTSYIRASLRRSLALALPIILIVALARPLIVFVYGAEYAPAVPIFHLLAVIILFDLFSKPLLLLIYPLNLPRFVAAADAARLVGLLIVGILLIPSLGMVGAALAKLTAALAGSLVGGVAIAVYLRRQPPGLPVALPFSGEPYYYQTEYDQVDSNGE